MIYNYNHESIGAGHFDSKTNFKNEHFGYIAVGASFRFVATDLEDVKVVRVAS